MLDKFLSQVREQVLSNIESVIGQSNSIEIAMNYSALSKSKMIRAALIFASAESNTDLKKESILTLATAIELIHTYSLIHDDLPSMDDDDFRRGKESNHIKFGEANAILAGDALQALAYEIIVNDSNLSSDLKVEAVSLLTKACGKNGMVHGQSLDIENESKKIDKSYIEKIHMLKTGMLIQCAVSLGQLGKKYDKYYENFKKFGINIGLAFQITDDLLEVTSDKQTLGKNINSDKKNNKATYVNVVGFDEAIVESKKLSDSAIYEISKENISNTEQIMNNI